MDRQRRHPHLAFLVLAALAAWFAPAAGRADREDTPRYKVIVHPANAVKEIKSSDLARMFLKKSTRWPGGRVVRPVDLQATSRVRREFTGDILKRTVGAVRSYWQQKIFSGQDVPPPELTTDAAIVRYVLRFKGAVGYVSADARVGRAKIVEVR